MGGTYRGKKRSTPCQLELFSRGEALELEKARYWRKVLRHERDGLEEAVARVIRRRVVGQAIQTGSGIDGKA